MLYMWSMISCMFPPVEYLHSMSCSRLLRRIVCWVSYEMAVRASGVAECPNKIRSVLCWPFLCQEDIFRYGLIFVVDLGCLFFRLGYPHVLDVVLRGVYKGSCPPCLACD